MFGFMKKHSADKEEKERKKLEKKDKKDKKDRKEKQLTPEELQRLEEAKRLYRHASDVTALKYTSSSEGSRECTPEASGGPIFTSTVQVDMSKPHKGPPVTQPKPKKSVVRAASSAEAQSLDAAQAICRSSEDLKNQATGPESAEGTKPASGEVSSRGGSVKQMAGAFENSSTRSGPPKKPSLTKPKVLPTKPHRLPAPLPSADPAGSINGEVNDLDLAIPVAPPSPAQKIYENVILPLPALGPPRALQPREVVLQRKPAGDFGMSLRKGSILERVGGSAEERRTVIFAEPSPNNLDSGLLPGDRLVAVNGQNVENISREEMIDIIKESGSCVQLTVKPIPELSELSLRSGVRGEDVNIVNQSTKQGGSLQRSGSMRFKQGRVELEVSRADQSGEVVWLIHKGGFTAARKQTTISEESGEQGGTKVKVKLEGSGEVLQVDEEDVELANPSSYDRIEDLSLLRFLNESSVLHTLRQRYSSNLIHTYAGRQLVVINPMHPLSVYSEKVMQMFRGCRAEDMPPHIYATAQLAYRGLLATGDDQSIVLVGRSGAGKTTNLKHVVQYLSVVAGTSHITADKLSSAFTILDSFGSSRTVLNTNATRFVSTVALDFDFSGQLVSLSIQAMLLEKTRLFRRPEGEPTFHVMYQMLAGLDEQSRKELQLENLTEENMICTAIQKVEDKRKAIQSWGAIVHAFSTLGVSDAEVKAVVVVLAAIYHLGGAGVTKGVNNKFQFARPAAAQRAAAVLGLNIEELNKAVFQSTFSATKSTLKPSSPSSPVDSKPDDPVSGSEFLEGFVSGLYSEVFHAVVGLINRAFSSTARSRNAIWVVDTPGFQNPISCSSKSRGASFTDLCHNYIQERLQLLHHQLAFGAKQDLYAQENIPFDFELAQGSPEPVVALIDRPSQQTLVRSSSTRVVDDKGILWLLDDEAVSSTAKEEDFVNKCVTLHGGKKKGVLVKSGSCEFTVSHFQGTNPVKYYCSGWLKACRENPVVKTVNQALTESRKQNVSSLFQTYRGPGAVSVLTGSVVGVDPSLVGGGTLRRNASMRRGHTTALPGVKRNSVCLQVKMAMDTMLENLRKTRVHFVHCLLPQANAGLSELRSVQLPPNQTVASEDSMVSVPLLRAQLRGHEILAAVRAYRQGYPDNLQFTEFRSRYEILVGAEGKPDSKMEPGKAVQLLLDSLEVDKTHYAVGLSLVFFRPGILAQLDDARDDRIKDAVIYFQAHCRGHLSRKRLEVRKRQTLAVRCIQRNIVKLKAIQDWPWWRLYNRLRPMLDVHRMEDQLKETQAELELLKAKYAKVEKERTDYKTAYDQLEGQVSDMRADLVEEHSSSHQTTEILEIEQAERMRLEKELAEIKVKYGQMERRCHDMELELHETRELASQLDAEMEDGEVDASIYKERYQKLRKELELSQKKLQREKEDEVEQLELQKKIVDKKLADAVVELEDREHQISLLKRKVTKTNQETADIRHHLDEQNARNSELEKKQKKFDNEVSKVQEQLKDMTNLKDKIQRERDEVTASKYTVEQELKSVKFDAELLKEKVEQLNRELNDVTATSVDNKEVITLKRQKAELERKTVDQEAELDEQAGVIQQLEQAKLKLEMEQENLRKQHAKEQDERDQELEDLRASTQKRLKSLENQLEEEYEEKQVLQREKRDLERKVADLSNIQPQFGRDNDARLYQKLRKAKILLKDKEKSLEQLKENAAMKAALKQLRDQLEDAEYVSASAMKARKAVEEELEEVQRQLAEMSRAKMDVENKVATLSRDKSELTTKVEDMDEEMVELMRKYKSIVAQQSADNLLKQEQSKQIEELMSEKQSLVETISQLESRIKYLQETTVDKEAMTRMDIKMRDVESRLGVEETARQKSEYQINRLKEQVEKLTEERDKLSAEVNRAQESEKRMERMLREAKSELFEVERKEADATSKKLNLERQLETIDADFAQAQSDLRLAFKRIESLQSAIEDELVSSSNSDLDPLPEYSDSDSDSDDDNLAHSTPLSRLSSQLSTETNSTTN